MAIDTHLSLSAGCGLVLNFGSGLESSNGRRASGEAEKVRICGAGDPTTRDRANFTVNFSGVQS